MFNIQFVWLKHVFIHLEHFSCKHYFDMIPDINVMLSFSFSILQAPDLPPATGKIKEGRRKWDSLNPNFLWSYPSTVCIMCISRWFFAFMFTSFRISAPNTRRWLFLVAKTSNMSRYSDGCFPCFKCVGA